MSGRLPQLRPADLDDAQRRLYDSLVAGEVPWADKSKIQVIEPDGTLLGPFNPLLFSPVLGAAHVGVFRADKSSTSLPARIHELIVLTVGAAWGCDYELYAHSAVAKAAGLPDAVIQALVSGQLPVFQSEQEAIAHEFTRQLIHRHQIEPKTYAEAEQAFGHKGLVDMVLLVGLYLTTCAIINAFNIPSPSPISAPRS